MTLSDLSIRKPVFAWMLMLGLVVFGMISFFNMGISRLPDVDFPVLNISVSWIGASPETMESAVTDVIEDAVMSVEGIRKVTSKCQEGLSNTSIEFELNRNINVALQEVQTKLAKAQKSLPKDVDPPVVDKSNPEDQPILWVALTGGKNLREKILFVRDRLKDRLTTLNGVGDVRLGGYVDPNMRIWLDSEKMRSHQISVDDIISSLANGSTLTPSGFMDNGPKETNIRVLSEASTPEEFNRLIIPSRGGSPIWTPLRIGDVAQVSEGLADIRRISRYSGESAIGLGVVKQRGSNAVAVARSVKERLSLLNDQLPQQMKLQAVIDSTRFIEESTSELVFTLTLSALLTSAVCWFFLGTWSAAFNVILAIPTSLIGTFIVLYFLGFTLNTFTLLALSLAIGIVVDDAIMVLENIVRYREKGQSRVRSALLGAREITGAAAAASIAILAIFLPVVFMKGIVGKFFYQFGITMSVAVALSLLEALTLTPMRCSQFLQSVHSKEEAGWINRGMNRLARFYERILHSCLSHRWTILFVAFLVFGISLTLVTRIHKEFIPPQDQSRLLVNLKTPMGSSLNFTDQVFKKAENFLLARPEINGFYAAIGGFQGGLTNQGSMFVVLKNPDERPITPPFTHRPGHQEMMTLIRQELSKIEGVKEASVIDLSLSGFTSGRSSPVSFEVQGPDWNQLTKISLEFVEKMKSSGLMTDVDRDFNPDMPEAQIIPDRIKAAKRGVTITNIANSISALVGSLRVGKYTDSSGHRDDVRIKLQDQDTRKPTDITRIWVRNNHGEMVALSDVVEIREKPSLLTITRSDRERAIAVFANIKPGQSQAEAIQYVEKTAQTLLPPGYHIVMSGNSEAFKESFQSLGIALVLGIFVAYMVLGAQFNSFIHPITVLLALPFSITGALLALWITGISINIYSLIGILLLMGIVKKNSILLVDFTNKRRDRGMNIKEALIEACPLRLRPIIMTSFATIAAAIPAAISFGPGAETTRPMAVVVIGGVFLSTLFTLIVVPCAYSLLAKLENVQHRLELSELDSLDHFENIKESPITL